MKRGSLRTQLIGWNIAALALLLCVLGVIIRYTVISSLQLSVERTLESRMRSFPLPPMMRGGRGFGMRFGGPRDAERSFGRPSGGEPRWQGGGGFGGFAPFGGHLFQPGGDLPKLVDSASDPRHLGLTGDPMGPRPMLNQASFDAALRTERPDSRRVLINGEPHQVMSVPLRNRGQLYGVGQIGYPLAEIDLAVSSLDTALLILMPVGLLCAGAAGSF